MVKVPQPNPTPWDLRCRLGGVPVRISPLFWVSSAVLGTRYYADPEAGGPGYFAFWMAAVLVSVLLHNLGQAWVGQCLGIRSEVTLHGLGGLTLGIPDRERRWQRLVVLLAGPAVNLLILAAVAGLTLLPFPDALRAWGWAPPVATGMAILVWINVSWAVLNLIPLWPLDGGQIAYELGERLFGRGGRVAALGLSIVVAGILAVWVTVRLSWNLNFPFDPRYALRLENDLILLVYCFLLWLGSVRALWAEPAAD